MYRDFLRHTLVRDSTLRTDLRGGGRNTSASSLNDLRHDQGCGVVMRTGIARGVRNRSMLTR